MAKRKARTESTFEASLKAATARLSEAQEERTAAQLSLAALDREIPVLERTIQALQAQLNPSAEPIRLLEMSPVQLVNGVDYLPGPVNEDEFLPDPEGDPVLPE